MAALRPKRLLLWSLLAAVLVVVAGGVVVWAVTPGPLESAHRRLEEGMDRSEVYTLIGQPDKSDEYTMHATSLRNGFPRGRWYFLVEEEWKRDDGTLTVQFELDKVWFFTFTPTKNPPFLQKVRLKLRSWLGH